MAAREEWDRMEGEGPRHFKNFNVYLLLTPETRSVLESWRVSSGQKEATDCPGHWKRMAAKFRWRERGEKYDDMILAKMRRLLEAKRLQMRERHMKIGEFMERVGVQSLSKTDPVTKERIPVEVNDPGLASEIAERGVKIARLAAGESTENISQKSKVENVPPGTLDKPSAENADLSHLTEAQLDDLEKILRPRPRPDVERSEGGTGETKPS
jgi:hypothetical protein